ncbi:hypothetical protein [Armatimonas rosea]|uniref:Uncharacterized protein n=1 Tax=Armatimonas rosea TaxID=685828 RepID=A0A7W9SVT4_ARMRO|nr:hypothetical protein [Armatimonas rosea]MBB6053303.1 hypothetical protein [Armatimonas rosea]
MGRKPTGVTPQTQARIPADLKALAQAEATRRGISLSELICEGLRHELERGPAEIAGQAAIEALRAEGYTVEK